MSIVLGPAYQTTTARDLITRALRLINVLARNEVPNPSEASDAMVVLNDMIDSWSLERGLILQDRAQVFTLTPGLQPHILGPGANFNTVRPTKIERVSYRSGSPANDRNIELFDRDQWSNISLKDQTGDPECLFVNASENLPFLEFYFWPVPESANQVVVYTWEAMQQLPGLDTTLAVPAGFRRALRYNLALELCPEYGKEADGIVVEMAMQSKAVIKGANLRNPILGIDSALSRPRGFNIVTGE
jgi:hypothetical protein